MYEWKVVQSTTCGLVRLIITLNTASHCEDRLSYLGHHKEPLRLSNKETSLNTENEVITVRGWPEAGVKKKKKMEKKGGGF